MKAERDVIISQARPLVAQPPETLSPDRHFPFDWNGWGIGVESVLEE
jgi:hypothetical protein